jgi:hypothetical protein
MKFVKRSKMQDFTGLYALNSELICNSLVSRGNALVVKRKYTELTKISDFGERFILSALSVN